MKYFTKEELEDITRELIENPTRETLKKLNEKYNNDSEVSSTFTKTIPNVKAESQVVAPTEMAKPEDKPVVEVLPPIVEESTVVSPISSIDTPNTEVPKDINNNYTSGPEIPSFELPKLEKPENYISIQNNEPINLTGNLWETQMPNSNNLMQTTDNFNSAPNTMSATEAPVENGQFFGSSQNPVNNSIPIAGTPTNQNSTMFGQFEKNYM